MLLYTPDWDRWGEYAEDELPEYLAERRLSARRITFKRNAFTAYPRALDPLLKAVESGEIATITNYRWESALEPRLRKLLKTHGVAAVRPNERIFRAYMWPRTFVKRMDEIAAAIDQAEVLIPPGLYGDSYFFALRPKQRRCLMARIGYDLISLYQGKNEDLELLTVPPDADPLYIDLAAQRVVQWIDSRDIFDEPLEWTPKYCWRESLLALVRANEPLSQMFTVADSTLDYSSSMTAADRNDLQTYIGKHRPRGRITVHRRPDWPRISTMIEELVQWRKGKAPGDELTRYLESHELEEAIHCADKLISWLLLTELGVEEEPLVWKKGDPWAQAMVDLAACGDLPQKFELDGTSLDFRRDLDPEIREAVLGYVPFYVSPEDVIDMRRRGNERRCGYRR